MSATQLPHPNPLITLEGVMEITTLSRSTIYRKIETDDFPPPRRLRGLRRAVWKTEEVLDWINKNLV